MRTVRTFGGRANPTKGEADAKTLRLKGVYQEGGQRVEVKGQQVGCCDGRFRDLTNLMQNF